MLEALVRLGAETGPGAPRHDLRHPRLRQSAAGRSPAELGDHAKNIAEYVTFLVKGKDVRYISAESIDAEELDR